MKATGEVMAIDRTFEAAFQKAVRSLEITGRSVLWEDPDWRNDGCDPLSRLPLHPNDERLWALLSGLRRGVSPEELSRTTGVDPWFTRAFEKITATEARLLSETLTPGLLREAKRTGSPTRRSAC